MMLRTLAAAAALFAAASTANAADTDPTSPAARAQVIARFKSTTPEAALGRIQAACVKGELSIERAADGGLTCSSSRLIETTDGSLKARRGVFSGPDGTDVFSFAAQAEGADVTIYAQAHRLIIAYASLGKGLPAREQAHRLVLIDREKAFLTLLGAEILAVKRDTTPPDQLRPAMAAVFRGQTPESVTAAIKTGCDQRNFTTRLVDPKTVTCTTTRLMETKDGSLQARLGTDDFRTSMIRLVFASQAFGADAVVFETMIQTQSIRVGDEVPKTTAQEKAYAVQLLNRVQGYVTSLGGQIVPLDAPITPVAKP